MRRDGALRILGSRGISWSVHTWAHMREASAQLSGFDSELSGFDKPHDLYLLTVLKPLRGLLEELRMPTAVADLFEAHCEQHARRSYDDFRREVRERREQKRRAKKAAGVRKVLDNMVSNSDVWRQMLAEASEEERARVQANLAALQTSDATGDENLCALVDHLTVESTCAHVR